MNHWKFQATCAWFGVALSCLFLGVLAYSADSIPLIIFTFAGMLGGLVLGVHGALSRENPEPQYITPQQAVKIMADAIPKPPTHVHIWHDPDFDLKADQFEHREDVNFILCGQVCDCGAKRLYEGPAYGWREL